MVDSPMIPAEVLKYTMNCLSKADAKMTDMVLIRFSLAAIPASAPGYAQHPLAGIPTTRPQSQDRMRWPHLFWGGRLLSGAAAVGIGIALLLFVRRVGGSWLACFLSATWFLSAPVVILWPTRIKPDLLALFWTSVELLLIVLVVPSALLTTARAAAGPWPWQSVMARFRRANERSVAYACPFLHSWFVLYRLWAVYAGRAIGK